MILSVGHPRGCHSRAHWDGGTERAGPAAIFLLFFTENQQQRRRYPKNAWDCRVRGM